MMAPEFKLGISSWFVNLLEDGRAVFAVEVHQGNDGERVASPRDMAESLVPVLATIIERARREGWT